MRWAIAAVAVVVAANAVTLLSITRERDAGAAGVATIPVCENQLVGGPGSDMAPALRLVLAPDSFGTAPGLDTAGLRALGHPSSFLAAVGQVRPERFPWPVERPAWVRLRPGADSLHLLEVAEVRARREDLTPDSASFIVRGLVGARERRDAQPAAEGHTHGAPVRYTPGIIYPAVLSVMPAQLHLSRERIEALRAVPLDSSACGGDRTVRVVSGVAGGVWVE